MRSRCRATSSTPWRRSFRQQGTGRNLQEDRHRRGGAAEHPLALAFVAKFMTEATTNGVLRKAYDNNGLKDNPIRVR